MPNRYYYGELPSFIYNNTQAMRTTFDMIVMCEAYDHHKRSPISQQVTQNVHLLNLAKNQFLHVVTLKFMLTSKILFEYSDNL